MRLIAAILITGILLSGCFDKKQGTLDVSSEKAEVPVRDTIKNTTTIEGKSIIAPKGTQMLEGSEKLYETRWTSGYFMENVLFTPCENRTGEVDYEKDKKIESMSKTDSSLSVQFNVVEHCCSEFLCEAEILNHNTLNLLYHNYGHPFEDHK